MKRCWESADEGYNRYHDEEWGRPVRDERGIYERLCLEGFQSGLSWLTILRKREAFRNAFAQFDPEAVAGFSARDVKRLLGDAGIVRHRGKIEAAILSARAWLAVMENGPGFASLVWACVDGRPIVNQPRSGADIPAQTPSSKALSKELVARGFRFCGPTTVYAFMQANGLVNDHVVTCFRHADCAALANGATTRSR